MKTNLFRTVSDWLLATSVILSVILFAQYYFRTHEMRGASVELQKEAVKYQQFHAQLNAQINPLLADVMEYSRRNPAINPILEQFGKPASTPAAPPNPAGK